MGLADQHREELEQRAEAADRKLAWALRTLRTVRHLVVGVSCCEQCFKCHQNAEIEQLEPIQPSDVINDIDKLQAKDA